MGEVIQPQEVHVHHANGHDFGKHAWKFFHNNQEREVIAQGILDTALPETIVDLIDNKETRTAIGSYAINVVVPHHVSGDEATVREVLANHLARVFERHDIKSNTDQLTLF